MTLSKLTISTLIGLAAAALLTTVLPSAPLFAADKEQPKKEESKAKDEAKSKDDSKPKDVVDPLADAMMVKAHTARSGWYRNFGGFKANVLVTIDGVRTKGGVTVGRDGSVE